MLCSSEASSPRSQAFRSPDSPVSRWSAARLPRHPQREGEALLRVDLAQLASGAGLAAEPDAQLQSLARDLSDLAQAFAKDLGASVKFVDSSFARLVDDLIQSKCDIAMFAIGITPARMEKLRFTKPYLVSDIYAITTKSNRRIKAWGDIDQDGVVISVAKGTLHEAVMREKLKSATLSVNATPQGREQDVESGRADVFMTDFPFSRRMLEQTDWARLVSPPSTYHLTSYAYAVAPGDDKWQARAERFVSDVKKDGRLAGAAKRHQLEPIVARD